MISPSFPASLRGLGSGSYVGPDSDAKPPVRASVFALTADNPISHGICLACEILPLLRLGRPVLRSGIPQRMYGLLLL